MSGVFGGIHIGQETLGTTPMGVFYFIRIAMPSPVSGGPSNVMNILSSTSLVLEISSNVMNILTPMVGSPLALNLGETKLGRHTHQLIEHLYKKAPQTRYPLQTSLKNLVFSVD